MAAVSVSEMSKTLYDRKIVESDVKPEYIKQTKQKQKLQKKKKKKKKNVSVRQQYNSEQCVPCNMQIPSQYKPEY